MSTFLELARRLRSESTMSGNSVTTTVGQSGDTQRLIEWVQSAYADIQNTHPSRWLFLRKDFDFSTVAAQAQYDPVVDCGLTDFGRWKTDGKMIYLTASGRSGEMDLNQVSWQEFLDGYGYGSFLSQHGFPMIVTERPNKSLQFYPVPDGDYTITGEYFRKRDVLSGDTAEPIFPEEFHEIIVWRALVYYGGREAAGEQYDRGQEEYRRLLTALMRDQLPDIQVGC